MSPSYRLPPAAAPPTTQDNMLPTLEPNLRGHYRLFFYRLQERTVGTYRHKSVHQLQAGINFSPETPINSEIGAKARYELSLLIELPFQIFNW